MLKEFKPSLFFIARFLGIYVVGNLLYGLYVGSFADNADGITYCVTQQTSFLLNAAGENTSIQHDLQRPTVSLFNAEDVILNVYEGCNGINVMIIFVAFMVAFGGPWKKMLWFIPVSIFLIHSVNLLRISFLYYIAQYYQQYFYYVHKYFFTAILYLVVFALWTFWIIQFHVRTKEKDVVSA